MKLTEAKKRLLKSQNVLVNIIIQVKIQQHVLKKQTYTENDLEIEMISVFFLRFLKVKNLNFFRSTYAIHNLTL